MPRLGSWCCRSRALGCARCCSAALTVAGWLAAVFWELAGWVWVFCLLLVVCAQSMHRAPGFSMGGRCCSRRDVHMKHGGGVWQGSPRRKRCDVCLMMI